MATILYFEIVISLYHNESVAKLRYESNGYIFESQRYSIPEINNLIALWKQGALLGSFGIGTILAEDAKFQLTNG